MARQKQRIRKATQNPQPDPWLAWGRNTQEIVARQQLSNAADQFNEAHKHLAYIKNSGIAQSLRTAALTITLSADEIIPEVPDIKVHPLIALEKIQIDTEETSPCSGSKISAPLHYLLCPHYQGIICHAFGSLSTLAAIWPHPQAVEQLKELAPNVTRLLLATHRFMQKKIAQAKLMGLKRAAKKLEVADKGLCIIEFSGDITKDTEQLFLARKITPNEFRVAIRKAFMLDREATDEINNTEAADNMMVADRKNSTDKPARRLVPSKVSDALSRAWDEYRNDPDKFTPDVLKRKKGDKPNYKELIKHRGDNEICDGKTLSQLLEEYKIPNENADDTLTRILGNVRKNKKRHPETP